MEELPLRGLFAICCSLPMAVAAFLSTQIGSRAGWGIAAVFTAALSMTADPLAFALLQVDGVITRSTCAN